MAKPVHEASDQFQLDVKAYAVRKILKRNGNTVSKPGSKGTFSEKDLNTREVAILSFLALLQANFHKKKKTDNIISVVQKIVRKLGNGRKLNDAASFWHRMQGSLVVHLDLDAESVIKIRHQFWAIYPNISLWYDVWEEFVFRKGLHTMVLFNFITE